MVNSSMRDKNEGAYLGGGGGETPVATACLGVSEGGKRLPEELESTSDTNSLVVHTPYIDFLFTGAHRVRSNPGKTTAAGKC